MNKKHKKQALAFTLAASVLLTGTFAWQSFSQRVTNETAGVDGNVGARLHNDFNGDNADVYVENYAHEGGTTVYTRVRVREYMEYGVGSGVLPGDGRDDSAITLVRGVKSVDATTPQIDKNETWDIYIYKENTTVSSEDAISFYKNINLGDVANANSGSKVYMPTFNKDFDDLSSDIKGALGDGGDRYDESHAYTEYVSYTIGEQLTDIATYSDQSDVAVNAGKTQIEETHTAKRTNEGYVITMEEWMGEDYDYAPGNYWVYDVDGWAYWANGLAPQTATSLLVDSISTVKKPDKNYYYGLHVEAQTASAGDWGVASSADVTEQGMLVDITADGEILLNTIAYPEQMGGVSVMAYGMSGLMEVEVPEVIILDGVSFYVLDRTTITGVDSEGYTTGRVNGALLLATDSIGDYTYHMTEDSSWANSEMRNSILPAWLDQYPTLAAATVRVPVVTDGYYYSEETYISTEEVDELTYDRVFLLSQMEVLATYGLQASYMVQTMEGGLDWMRSPASAMESRVLDSTTGYISEQILASNDTAGVRPALWVAYD